MVGVITVTQPEDSRPSWRQRLEDATWDVGKNVVSVGVIYVLAVLVGLVREPEGTRLLFVLVLCMALLIFMWMIAGRLSRPWERRVLRTVVAFGFIYLVWPIARLVYGTFIRS